jgi:glutaminyl-peptide cyclotransferase
MRPKRPACESLQGKMFLGSICAGIFVTALMGCKAKGEYSANSGSSSAGTAPFMSALASAPPRSSDDAPPPESTGGFDGRKAFAHVARQVNFGPRPSGSQAIVQTQNYIQSELKSYGCTVEIDSFTADTPTGRLPMKNILVKIPGEKPGVILLGTHYDTLRKENFVGADDSGSSTAVMLELARLLCSQGGKYAAWIAFFDGEEAMKQWSDTDSRYGSREMAARFANRGDIKKIRAFLLADIVGGRTPHFLRETSSTPTLTDLVWRVAAKLGYSSIFVNDETAEIQDDHDSFLRRNVPSVDVIDLDRVNDVPYWHTPQDALDKISAKTLAIVGHVFLESVKELQAR